MTINSHKRLSKSQQIEALKKSKKSISKIVIDAHMDTKYNITEALDKAAEIVAFLQSK